MSDTPSFGRMLWRGVTRRCPRCGAGHLFSRWFRMADRCPRCGYRFQREEASEQAEAETYAAARRRDQEAPSTRPQR